MHWNQRKLYNVPHINVTATVFTLVAVVFNTGWTGFQTGCSGFHTGWTGFVTVKRVKKPKKCHETVNKTQNHREFKLNPFPK